MAKREAWAQRVAEWAKSGLTSEEYSAREGINANSLKHWKWKLGAEARRGSVPMARAVRMKVHPLASAVSAADAGLAALVMELGDWRVRVSRGCDRATLMAVLEALRSVR